MTRRHVIFLSFAILIVAVVIIYICFPKEPRYEGRALSSWLKLASKLVYDPPFTSDDDLFQDPKFEPVRTAVRSIGTNALPYLIKWSEAPDSGAREYVARWINNHLPSRFSIWSAPQQRVAAEVGFRLLGEKANPACPVFVQWTFDKLPARRTMALDLLVHTDADDATMLPVYRRMINDGNHYIREQAATEYYRHFRKEAVTDGLYEKFPQLNLQNIVTFPRSTNQPPPKK